MCLKSKIFLVLKIKKKLESKCFFCFFSANFNEQFKFTLQITFEKNPTVFKFLVVILFTSITMNFVFYLIICIVRNKKIFIND